MENNETEFLPFSYTVEKSMKRTLFMKRHSGNDDNKPSERTLYIVNIPQFLTKKSITELFTSFGEINNVYLQSKPSSGLVIEDSKYFPKHKVTIGSKVGYVVFNRPVSLRKALKSGSKTTELPQCSHLINGKKKWIKNYNSQFIDSKDLLTEIESFMSAYDEKVEEEKQKDKEAEGVMDEDGWITITKQSKKPKIPRTETMSKKLVERQKRAQAKLTLVNFYKCQLKNAKMDQITELRKKFESDKKRLALMKASRKFKPF